MKIKLDEKAKFRENRSAYGGVLDWTKILHMLPIGETRAESPATGPLLYHISVRLSIGNLYKNLIWFLVKMSLCKMHKKSDALQRHFISFAYRHFDGFGLLLAIKSVISDKLAYALILPPLAGFILISQSVILWQRKRKVIFKLTARRHSIVGTFLIVAGMLFSSAVKVICSTDFKNVIPVFVDIMTYI